MSAFARKLVSKKKRRFRKDGFDLDLTYITDNLIAMGFPSENLEGVYRNPMSEVVRYFDSRHKDHYKVYNLCSERCYDAAKFHGRVARYPFDDHNAPPIELFMPFCEDVHQWLTADKENVAVIHCKAGKGRTGVMICAYLLYASTKLGNPHTDKWKNPDDALQFYGAQRTENQKGVTIPSQLRYVKYFGRMVQQHLTYQPVTIFLKKITIHTIPKMASNNSCSPMFVVTRLQNATISSSNATSNSKSADAMKLYASRTYDNVGPKEKLIEMPVSSLVPMAGDIKIEFFHKDKFKKPAKMFHLWFNTFFIENNQLVLVKSEIDKANKDKKHQTYDENLRVVIEFASAGDLGLQSMDAAAVAAAVATSASSEAAAGAAGAAAKMDNRASILYDDAPAADGTEDDDDLSDDESVLESDVAGASPDTAGNTGDTELA